MIREHIMDLFTEGLGDIFFMRYYNFLNKHIKYKNIRWVLIEIHKALYLAFLGFVVYIIFKLSWPL